MPSELKPPSPRRPERTLRIVLSEGEAKDEGVARYCAAFTTLLERHLEVPTRPVQALDLACGPGTATLPLCRKLPSGSRVVALSADRVELHRLHDSIPPELAGAIYPRKERRDRLPFALGVFDLVWASLAGERLEPFRPILRQALRVLRPGGQLLVATPLKSTFVELARAIGPFLTAHRDSASFQVLMSESLLLDAEGWSTSLRRSGAVDVAVDEETLELTIPPPLSSQLLFVRYLMPLWVGEDPATQTDALALLDQAVLQPLSVRVRLACVRGRRGQSEVEESRSGQ